MEWDDFGVHFNAKNAGLEENSIYVFFLVLLVYIFLQSMMVYHGNNRDGWWL